ncbi:MAG: DUF4878 domain-containing protein [Bacteroidaceae bacterium]|nr:DUF4878 domain-containing protein [Bacteroidaceae bacterium]
MLTIACSGDDHSRARRAAEKSYEYLQKGKYEKFVGEIAYADSMSDDYRAQMVDLVHEYAATLQQHHGAFTGITAVNDTIVGEQAHVYLQITFADSTSEEIGVPMVKVGKKWKMQ